jgi:gas vesicle protein
MNYRERDSHAAGFTAGVVTGALVGAGLALLFAPRAGSELRGEMGQSWNSLRDAVGRRYRDLADRAGVELNNLSDRIEQTARSVESKANEFINSAADHARTAPSGRGMDSDL